jgi:hypothetical protein
LTMLGAAPSVARGSLVSVAPARSRSELLTADPAKPTVTGARHALVSDGGRALRPGVRDDDDADEQ